LFLPGLLDLLHIQKIAGTGRRAFVLDQMFA
jgi:hypothetical protein